MNKKLCLSLFSICFLTVVTVRAQWVVEKCPSGNNLKAIVFTGSNTGWIVGDKGTILHKSDNQWINFQNPAKNNLNSIFMISETEGWAVGDKGTILHYNGKCWDVVESPVKNNLYSVSFNNPEEGTAVGANGVIIRYENRNWKTINRKIHGNLYVTSAISDATWIGGGLECVSVPIVKIQNDQSGKMTNTDKLTATITGLSMINQQEGWAVGSPSTIMHYDGNQWNKSNLAFSYPSLRSVFFSDMDNGISAGYGGAVLIYSGGTWASEKSSTTNNLNGALITGNSYYAVGDNGIIITKKMDQDKVIKSTDQIKLFTLSVFPNPSAGIINFLMPVEIEYSNFTALISNNDGKVVLQKEFQTGNGNLPYQIVTDNLSNGLYLLKVNAGNRTFSSKFIINH